MTKNLLRFFMIFTIFQASNVSAVIVHDENDLELSKRSPIISSIPYNDLIQNEEKMGVMTLCFATPDKSVFDHVSLVFEMFLPNKPNELGLRMLHYCGVNDCCGAKDMKIRIENEIDTLKRAYRAIECPIDSNTKIILPPKHKKYASWIISNDKLVEVITKAENDIKNKVSYKSCVKYVSHVMKSSGLKKVDFGWWTERAENLKKLVNDYIEPKPNNRYL